MSCLKSEVMKLYKEHRGKKTIKIRLTRKTCLNNNAYPFVWYHLKYWSDMYIFFILLLVIHMSERTIASDERSLITNTIKELLLVNGKFFRK